MSKVFISHSSKDKQVATAICNALENRGLPCWFAGRNVGPGDNFQESIVRAIRAAKVMVLVFSDNANQSAEITKELALASQHRLIVIPARVEDVVPSEALAYELATRQWIDLFQDWDDAIGRLAASISSVAGTEPATLSGAGAADAVAAVTAHVAPPGGMRRTPGSAGPAKGTAVHTILTFNAFLLGSFLLNVSAALLALMMVFVGKDQFAAAFAATVFALPLAIVGRRTIERDMSVRMFGMAIGIIGLIAVGAVNLVPNFFRVGLLEDRAVQNGFLLMGIYFLAATSFYGWEWKKLSSAGREASGAVPAASHTLARWMTIPWLSGLIFAATLLFVSVTWQVLYRLSESIAAVLLLIACHVAVVVFCFLRYRKELRSDSARAAPQGSP